MGPEHIVFWIAVAVFHEAGVEDDFGKLLVAKTVVNRMEDRKQTAYEVVNSPAQYSPKIKEVLPDLTTKTWADCKRIASLAMQMDTYYTDVYYFHNGTVDPKWAHSPKVQFIGKWGGHYFYNEL